MIDIILRLRTNSDLQPSDLPLPVLTINNLNDKDSIKSYRILLKDKGGIYSFINTVNGNQYIGSAKDFYLRLNEHFLRSARRKIRSLIWLCKKHLLSMA